MNEPTVSTVPVHTKQPAKIGENVTFSLIFAHTLHTAAEPGSTIGSQNFGVPTKRYD